jgi:hypothetical protein
MPNLIVAIAYILSLFLWLISNLAAACFLGSRRLGPRGGPSNADARLIAICELDTGRF